MIHRQKSLSLPICIIIFMFLGALLSGEIFAQVSVKDALAEYREMLADANPADLFADTGKERWEKALGPHHQSLAKNCDLGLGVGIIKGASASLPRYFKDTNKVQDLESRLMTCMQRYQGINPDEIVHGKWGKGKLKDMEDIVTYIVSHSKGMKVNVSLKHPKEKLLYEAGKYAFFYRGGPYDFSCATCHNADGKRIRLQDLPNLTKPEGAIKGWGSWPAYRIGNGQLWTMQHRLQDCFRQQRMPKPIYGSDLTIALSMYMAANSNNGEILTPGIKR